MPEKLIMIIKLLGRGGSAGMIKSCVITRNIFCLGNAALEGMCVLPPEKLGAGMSFLQKQNRQEPKGGKKKKERKAKPNKCLTGHDRAARALKRRPGEIP